MLLLLSHRLSFLSHLSSLESDHFDTLSVFQDLNLTGPSQNSQALHGASKPILFTLQHKMQERPVQYLLPGQDLLILVQAQTHGRKFHSNPLKSFKSQKQPCSRDLKALFFRPICLPCYTQQVICSSASHFVGLSPHEGPLGTGRSAFCLLDLI